MEPVEDGPGLVSARFYMYRAEECPGGTTQLCEATCPVAEDVSAECAAECAERCDVVARDNSQNAGGSSMTVGANAGAAVAAIFVGVAVIGAAYTYSRKAHNGSGHVQVSSTAILRPLAHILFLLPLPHWLTPLRPYVLRPPAITVVAGGRRT
jgi:hypothetical protein